ncbi:MAG: hypothetical protein SGI90_16695 [Candidatus Eisenbacteria bacterium]|nr:hypothetical protein [Candidatus Eisenbacteria bacterium]
MEPNIRVALAPTPNTTFLLATNDRGTEILRARLAAPSQINRWAAPTFLEGLSLWGHSPLSVALVVDDEATSFELQLSDGKGQGWKTLFYDVEVVIRPGLVRPDFGELKQICRQGVR